MALPFFIYGAGGHGRVVKDVATSLGLSVTAFLDDAPRPGCLNGTPVWPPSAIQDAAPGGFEFIIAVGRNETRAVLFQRLAKTGRPRTLVHPSASISSWATIGAGTVVMAGVVVNANARIEDDVILNTCCSIDHDCVIEAHSHICPGVHLAGDVMVGSGTMIGTGASAIPGVRIGQGCLIGAGACVISDMPPGSIAVGVPARVKQA